MSSNFEFQKTRRLETDGVLVVTRDRIFWLALLITLAFFSTLLLSSQSRASYPTYALALLVLATYSQWNDVFKLALYRWVILLLAWLLASTFWSTPFEVREVGSYGLRALLVATFVIALAECHFRGQVQKWLGFGLTLVGGLAIVASIAVFHLTNPEDGRLNGLGQLDTHVIAALVFGVIGLFAIRQLIEVQLLAAKLLAVFVIAMALVAVVMSDSRNAWVAVALGIVTFLLAHRTNDAKRFLVSVLSLVIVGALLLFVLISGEGWRNEVLPRGASFRPEIWLGALEKLDGLTWLWGIGLASPEEVATQVGTFDHPHNMYLSILVQSGLIGLGLYATLLLSCVRVLLRYFEHPDSKFALAVLALALSAHLLDGHELLDRIGSSWWLIWLPVGIGVGLSWRGVTYEGRIGVR